MSRSWRWLVLLWLPLWGWGQGNSFRVMTYNVENLFDTCHDYGCEDQEFLPDAVRQWNSVRYWKKQGDLSRTLIAAGGVSPLELVALVEVENDSVISHLLRRTRLYRLGYEYVMTTSRDSRGIDVALLYQPERFRLLEKNMIHIPFDARREKPTRDVLHVAGRLQCGDTLDVLVYHWPSRRGGSRAAEHYRYRAARRVRAFADSLAQLRRCPKILLLGDFNDEYSDRSIAEGLGAVAPGRPGDYVVLSAGLKAPGGIQGTYKFRGEWNQLDQVIVHRCLLEARTGLRTIAGGCRILAFPFLLEPDEARGGFLPRRTFLGPVYKGGVSDHLPLLLEMEW